MRTTLLLLAILAIGCGEDSNCGLGDACTTNDDCPCDNLCAAKSCVLGTACDEALLNFTTPTQNTDGSCLTDLGGFYLYWDPNEDFSSPTMIDLGLPCVDDVLVPCGSDGEMAMQQVCSYRLGGLPNGTVYFAVSTYNTSGVESERSTPASKEISCL